MTSPGGGPFTTARALARLGCRGVVRRRAVDATRSGRTAACRAGSRPTAWTSRSRPRPTSRRSSRSRSSTRPASRPTGSSRRDRPRRAFEPADLAGGLPADTAALHVGTLGLVLEPTADDDRGPRRNRAAGRPRHASTRTSGRRRSATPAVVPRAPRTGARPGRRREGERRRPRAGSSRIRSDRRGRDRLRGRAGRRCSSLTDGAGPVRVVTAQGVRASSGSGRPRRRHRRAPATRSGPASSRPGSGAGRDRQRAAEDHGCRRDRRPVRRSAVASWTRRSSRCRPADARATWALPDPAPRPAERPAASLPPTADGRPTSVLRLIVRTPGHRRDLRMDRAPEGVGAGREPADVDRVLPDGIELAR